MLRPHWLLFAALTLCLVPILVLNTAPLERVTAWFVHSTRPGKAVVEVVPEPDYYDWHTRSAFNPVRVQDAANRSAKELCASFPSHLLESIQLVMKTGHGVLAARVRPQLRSISACLTNPLIFSDLDEEFEGHDVIDVIADIPEYLREDCDQLQAYQNDTFINSNGSRQAGWVLDKWKFLPAVSRAWKMRPERRWYVFYEADTYVVWDSLFRLLAQYNPDIPHYFGSPSPGAHKSWMANGGPGFVLSREAMRRLVKDDWDPRTGEYLGTKLTERSWDQILHDCCGDSVLGWALWNVNVSLSGLWPMFNPHPPHGVPFSDAYWCQPIVTMHKPNIDAIAGLFRWQFEHREVHRPLLYRDLATSYFRLNAMTSLDDWNNAAWDGFHAPVSGPSYSHDPHASVEACSSACGAHSTCFQWTYHHQKCTFVRSIRFGKHQEPSIIEPPNEGEPPRLGTVDGRFKAGWATEDIIQWMNDRPCERVQWVRPSTDRIV